MTAAVSLDSFDHHDLAPGDWSYVADLLHFVSWPVPAAPESGVRVTAVRITKCPPATGMVPCNARSLTSTAPTCVCTNPVCVAAHEEAMQAAHARAKDKYRPRELRDPEVEFWSAALNVPNGVIRGGRSQAEGQEDKRTIRTFSKADQAIALDYLQAKPVRRGTERAEVLSTAWLELVEPTVKVAAAEAELDIERLAEKAYQRAWSRIRNGK